MTPGKTSFSTAIGVCAVEWTEYGIARFRLPDISAGVGLQAQTGDILALDDVPAEVMIVIDAVRDLVSGKNIDLSTTRLDMRKVSAFNKRVYAEALKIPRGKTITYGILAAAIGDKGAAQAVGRALGDNPIPLIIPCHRIVAANGAMHGFSAPGGVASKRRLLEIEGAIEPEPPTLFDFADM
jgi:methylated-DNA-[protein]-cysteine S-methyltransferase